MPGTETSTHNFSISNTDSIVFELCEETNILGPNVQTSQKAPDFLNQNEPGTQGIIITDMIPGVAEEGGGVPV